jgi:hypothetical protein
MNFFSAKKFFITISIILLFLAPVIFVYGQAGDTLGESKKVEGTGFVTDCVQTRTDSDGKTTEVYGNCGFTDLIDAVKKIANFMVTLGLSFSVVVIALAGWKYMKSGDNPGERKEANEMLQKVAIGIGWILAAWLIVNLIMTALVGKQVLNFISNT